MADLPSYVKIIFSNYGESFDPSVESTEMERGPPKERLINTQVMMKLSVILQFESPQDAISFDDWYFNTISRIGWFNVKHPRLGVTIQMRFEKGYCGNLTTPTPGFAFSQRQATLEYLR